MIGIIGAMDIEIETIIKNLDCKNKIKKLFLEFYTGTLFNKEVVVVKSNEGKVNSALATQIMIENFDIEYIINVGVAGSLVDELNVYDLIVGEKVVEFDSDVTALGYEKGYLFGIDKIYINANINLYKHLISSISNLDFNFKTGIIATSDKFVVNKEEKEYIHNQFNAIAVDMESASIAHTAYLNNIPMIIFRVISDSGSDIEYKKFSAIAANRIFDVMKEYFSY